ncbi:MAG: TRAP transporter large permease [Lachnospiraceae bacterium]|nr:TRAP transporter large permease [Lachnospiraceae bacterium]
MLFAWAILAFLVVSIVMGIPMVVGFASASLLPLVMGTDGYDITQLITWILNGNSNTYLAITFFVVAGNIMSKGNISEKVYELFAYFLGDKNGFLPICALLTATFYGMVSGSAIAVTAAVGSLCLPILTRAGYDKKYFATILCSSGCLGMIIPPSTTVLTAAGLMGIEDTTPALRLTMLIGLTCMVFLMACSLVHTRKDQGNREQIMREFVERREKGLARVFAESIWALMIPVIILGTIFSGLLTANEAAAVSVVYCMIISVYVYKTMTWKDIWNTIIGSIKTFGPLCIMMAVVIGFSNVIPAAGANEFVGNVLQNVPFNSTAFMLITVICISLMGFFMAGTSVLVPIMLPLATQLGIDMTLWCAIVAAVGAFALLTPPYGYGLLIMAPMADVPVGEMFKKVLPFWLGLTLIAVIYAVFPGLTAWLL